MTSERERHPAWRLLDILPSLLIGAALLYTLQNMQAATLAAQRATATPTPSLPASWSAGPWPGCTLVYADQYEQQVNGGPTVTHEVSGIWDCQTALPPALVTPTRGK